VFRQSLIAAALAVATVTASAMPSNAETASRNAAVHHRAVVHRDYTYEPAPSPYYYDPYWPSLCSSSCRCIPARGGGLSRLLSDRRVLSRRLD
jgi:hypothetical protein